MKKISLSCFIAVVALCVFSGCSPKQPEKDYTWLKQGIETAALQLKFTVAEIGDSIRLPRSIWTGYDPRPCWPCPSGSGGRPWPLR